MTQRRIFFILFVIWRVKRKKKKTYRIRLFRSRSFVATIYTRCLMSRSTRQSSAYVPLWSHLILSNRGSLATRRARRYFWPSFSSSASTQSVITGMHLAYRQSIMVGMTSSLCWMVWDMKLVSTRTEYGGVKAVLYWKKRDDGAWGLWWY